MSQRQLHDPARTCGEEAGGTLQHLTQVNPRKADLIRASMRVNATPREFPFISSFFFLALLIN